MDPEVTRKAIESDLAKLAHVVDDGPCQLIAGGEDPPSLELEIRSRSDGEVYYLKGQFEDYPSIPPLWEFYDPETGKEGLPEHYPKDRGGSTIDTIFLDDPVICHPASRKAYSGYTGKHSSWEMDSWQEIKNDNVTDIPSFVDMIVSRINSPFYVGRMS